MSLHEIYIALINNQNVYWMNEGYKVILDNGALHTVFVRNSSMCRLHPSELKDCFVK